MSQSYVPPSERHRLETKHPPSNQPCTSLVARSLPLRHTLRSTLCQGHITITMLHRTTRLVLAAFLTTLHLSTSQTLQDLPTCAQTPITQAIGSSTCSPTDFNCVCNDAAFVDGLKQTVSAACSEDEVKRTLAFAQALCGTANPNIGVEGTEVEGLASSITATVAASLAATTATEVVVSTGDAETPPATTTTGGEGPSWTSTTTEGVVASMPVAATTTTTARTSAESTPPAANPLTLTSGSYLCIAQTTTRKEASTTSLPDAAMTLTPEGGPRPTASAAFTGDGMVMKASLMGVAMAAMGVVFADS